MPSQMRQYTYREKMEQATREAKATFVGLLLTVGVWIALGFGLSGFDIEIFSTPLWVIGGTVGVWLFSIVLVIVLRKFFFQDFDLGEEHDEAEMSCAVEVDSKTKPNKDASIDEETSLSGKGETYE